jgi:hypothetical protein
MARREPEVPAGPTYEMLWDCASCGTTGLLGLSHRHCASCGAVQDPDRRYYPPDHKRVAVEDHPLHGADRMCGACDAPNSVRAACCVGCGSPLDGARLVGVRSDLREGVEDSATAAAAEVAARRQAEREARFAAAAAASGAAVAEETGPAPVGRSKARLGCGVAVLAIAACAGVFLFWRKDVSVEVTGHTWERTIDIEAFRTVSESDWDENVPADARNRTCAREERGSRQVQTGEDCHTVKSDNGDGTYSERQECSPTYSSEPEYDLKCRYEVDRWVKVDTAGASGASVADTPVWPEVRIVGQQREGARKQTYTVSFAGPDDTYACEVSQEKWASMAVGSRWTGQAGVLSGALDCGALIAR